MTDETRWERVVGRDARYDGTFVYAVTSTGIFCRPSCAAKRPRRENVRFFETVESAQAAGFRPCKRCQPERLAPSPVATAAHILSNNPTLTLAELGHQVGHAPEHLQKVFKAQTGISPHEFAAAQRVEKLRSQLKMQPDITTAQNEAGYASTRALYEDSANHLGMTPASYGKGAKGATIRFTIAPCELGLLLVARTDKGLCSVTLGDDEATLEGELRQEFHSAQIERDDTQLRPQVEAILAALKGQEPLPQLPLDVRATAFQMRVWKELRAIPRGETRSYAQIAEQIGQPTAVRAVARANATNPIALLTPCHRVVGSDGKMRGYRWSIERKQKILELEKG